MVVNCDSTSGQYTSATLRVKQIADCNVYTEALTIPSVGTSCPTQESHVLYFKFPVDGNGEQIVLHDQNGDAIPGIPIFTKIKNWDPPGATCSFDVLINFWQPPQQP